jgi:hypothetical protein
MSKSELDAQVAYFVERAKRHLRNAAADERLDVASQLPSAIGPVVDPVLPHPQSVAISSRLLADQPLTGGAGSKREQQC